MTSIPPPIPPAGSSSVSLKFTIPEADKKPLTAMSLARRNSIAFKEFILTKAFKEMGYDGQSTFRKASNLTQLLNKIDDLKKGYSGGEGLVDKASQSEGGPKVAILNIFHPDYDANNLTPENRDILRAASYFEGVNFNNLTGIDFDKFNQVSKALGATVSDYGLPSNDSTTSEAEATIAKILNDLKGGGIVV